MGEKTALTIYLLKPDQVASFEKEFLNSQSKILLIDPLDGAFVPLASVGKEPAWVGTVRSVLQDPITIDMTSKSPAGLLVIRRPKGTFVLTFGHAWMMLEDSWLERDFGRRVALNAIPKDEVIEIKAEQVFAKWHLASERSPRASPVDEFGVDFDRDLVATIEGVPSLHPSLGGTIRGGTSLRVSLPFTDLESTLDKSFSLFESTVYKKDWPDIDNINPLRDDLLIAGLDKALDDDLTTGLAKARIALFTPSQRRAESVVADSYVYGRFTQTAASTPYLTFDGWVNFLAREKLPTNLSQAKATKVHILDDSKTELKYCSIYDCFGYEISHGGATYVLSSGIWYEVTSDFVERINKTIKSILKPGTTLPGWNPAHSEAQYNSECAKLSGFLNCDAKNLHYGGGQSKFEFCDVLHPKSRTLYFAKIVSRSTGMSHLTEQVRRTAELLFSADNSYRKNLVGMFKKYHPMADVTWLKSRPRQGDWNLCMVSLGKKAENLPFFAKCGLAKTYKDLIQQGHTVSFIHV